MSYLPFFLRRRNYTSGSPAMAAQVDLYGFYITTPDYILRPEVIESDFYAWCATGDSQYLERAEQEFRDSAKSPLTGDYPCHA